MTRKTKIRKPVKVDVYPDEVIQLLWIATVHHSNACYDQGAAGRDEITEKKKAAKYDEHVAVALSLLIDNFAAATGWKPVFVVYDGYFVQSETEPGMAVWTDPSRWEFEEV